MKKVELKELVDQQKKLSEIRERVFEKENGEKFKEEAKEDWLKIEKEAIAHNKIYMFKNIAIVIFIIAFFTSIAYLCSFISDFYSEEQTTNLKILAVSFIISVVFCVMILLMGEFFEKIKIQSFEDYYKERYENKINGYGHSFVLSKEDLKPLYQTLVNYYGEEKLYDKMEETKSDKEQIGSYNFLYKLFSHAIREEHNNLNSAETLGKQVKMLIED